jgi:hypothetical protein
MHGIGFPWGTMSKTVTCFVKYCTKNSQKFIEEVYLEVSGVA